MFLNTMSRIHCKLQGFWYGGGEPEVSPRWRGPGRRQGRQATITFGYQPKASGKDTGQRPWGRRPDLRATAHAADPKDQRQQSLMSVGMRKRNSENMGYRSCRSDKYPVRGVRKLTTNYNGPVGAKRSRRRCFWSNGETVSCALKQL